MPRFLPTHVACLKRTMLAWSGQRFMFTPQNVQAIVQETGLNQAQVQVWAENFRMRYTADKERLEYLRADGLDKPVRDHPSILGVGKFFDPKLEGRVT